MLLLLACYVPPGYLHPAPAEVTMNDVLAGAVDEAGNDEPPGTDDVDEEEIDEADAEEPDTEADFGDQAVRPYTAFTLRTPLSIVDDAGQPVAVIARPGTEVEVIAEGTLRVKVRCVGCSPVVEGYLQADAVQR